MGGTLIHCIIKIKIYMNEKRDVSNLQTRETWKNFVNIKCSEVNESTLIVSWWKGGTLIHYNIKSKSFEVERSVVNNNITVEALKPCKYKMRWGERVRLLAVIMEESVIRYITKSKRFKLEQKGLCRVDNNITVEALKPCECKMQWHERASHPCVLMEGTMRNYIIRIQNYKNKEREVDNKIVGKALKTL